MNIFEPLIHSYDYDFRGKVFLECGTGADGVELEPFESIGSCFYIEANPDHFQKFTNKYPTKQVYNMALSDIDGEVDFVMTSHSGNSSISHHQEHIKELISYGSTFQTIKCKSITYPSLMSMIGSRIDVFVLDVEGHELSILKSLLDVESDILPDILVVECGYDWKDRLHVLKQLGYGLDFHFYNNGYLSKQQIVKRQDVISRIRNMWKTWTWNNTVIYDGTEFDLFRETN